MNNELVHLIDKVNRLQNEVDALKRIESATITNPFMAVPLAVSTVLSWPNLRAFLPPSGIYDSSVTRYVQNFAVPSRNFDFSISGTPEIRNHNGWRPQMSFSGTGEWLRFSDSAHFDILGTENYVNSAWRGLTIGGWVWFDSSASANEYIISKTMSTTNVSYILGRNSSGYGMFVESPDGTFGGQDEILSTDIIDGAKWVFMCGRFDPANELKLWLNGETYTTSIGSSSIYNGIAAVFLSGRDDTTTPGQRLLSGTMSMVFICGAYLPDETINNYYNLTKNIYDNLWTP